MRKTIAVVVGLIVAGVLATAGCADPTTSARNGVTTAAPATSSAESSLGTQPSHDPEPSATGSAYPKPSEAPTFPPPPTLTPQTGDLGSDAIGPQLALDDPKFVLASAWGLNCSGRYFYIAAGSDTGAGRLIVTSSLDVGAADAHTIQLPAPTGVGALTIDSGDCTSVRLHDASGHDLTWDVGATGWAS